MTAPEETPGPAAPQQPSPARAFARRHLPVAVRRASVKAMPMLQTPRGTRGVPRRQLRARRSL
jgi:hypothetical protein